MKLRTSKNMSYIIVVFICISICAFLFSILLFLRPNVMEGPAMEPTVSQGSYVFFNPFANVQRGDIVRYKAEGRGVSFVHRIVAVGGDLLEFRDGLVYVNGTQEQYDDFTNIPQTEPGALVSPAEIFTVPNNHVVLLGDNRSNSYDSRVTGPVPTENITGVLLFSL